MFHRKGQIVVPRSAIDEERIFELALEAGAEELTNQEDRVSYYHCSRSALCCS